MTRVYESRECVNCKRFKPIAAHGLCRACYGRWKKTGSTEYQRWGKINTCQIEDCKKPVVSNGLCDMHRQRLRSHGSTDERTDDRGARYKHPLYQSWIFLRRRRGIQFVAPEWQDDFLQFTIDIGERPSPKHKLFVADESKPMGPGNFVWKRAITEKVDGEDKKTYQARVARVRRAMDPEGYRKYDLRRHYGLSRDGYAELSKKQDHKCCICKQPETAKIRGKLLALCVDHCHTKGAVRGLLCTKCNQGLGCFRDDPATLRRAAEYIDWPERLI